MTKLEQKYPEIGEKVRELDLGKLYYHSTEYWVDDIQLTYKTNENGKNTRGWPERKKTAMIKLGWIEEARKQPDYGGLATRAKRIIDGLEKEVIPTFRPGKFNYYIHPSRDKGIACKLPFGGYDLQLELVGEKHLKVRDSKTWRRALEMLRALVAERLRSRAIMASQEREGGG